MNLTFAIVDGGVVGTVDGLVVLLGELAEAERHLDGDRGRGALQQYSCTERFSQADQQQNGGFANTIATSGAKKHGTLA